MTRRNFFAKLCAVATTPFAVKAVPKRIHKLYIPKWLNVKDAGCYNFKWHPGWRELSSAEEERLIKILEEHIPSYRHIAEQIRKHLKR